MSQYVPPQQRGFQGMGSERKSQRCPQDAQEEEDGKVLKIHCSGAEWRKRGETCGVRYLQDGRMLRRTNRVWSPAGLIETRTGATGYIFAQPAIFADIHVGTRSSEGSPPVCIALL